MTRFWHELKTDVRVQFRNKLYHIGIIISLLVAIVLSQLVNMEQLGYAFPALVVLIIGGTTMLYVAGMVIFEKDEGTIAAAVVTPLLDVEYLAAKVASLVLLATFETVLSLAGAMAILALGEPIIWPNPLWLVLGIIAVGVVYTLIGLALVVRYDSITEFLIPMAVVAVTLQLPFLYFFGLVEHWSLLVIPTSAPTMVIMGAYRDLALWEQIYALSYSTLLLLGLGIWAKAAFDKHIIENLG
ncbi:ABC transporter permease [Maritalea mediterranea]|uniref:ABC transporter permease n=1 Tax=Maritalea mediterranea TaxID=2909667 RepID=A0ABS9E9U0_9HYPH|nr:ABC transporter permease [Maritalea mediterranea]MCF4099602.1 ABC transporter permease [Maritalea mediterranea]